MSLRVDASDVARRVFDDLPGGVDEAPRYEASFQLGNADNGESSPER